MAKTKSKKQVFKAVAKNKKALHDYFIEERFEAGIVLHGWEVKSLRAGKLQLRDSYALLKDGEIWLLGAHISPLLSASTHVKADPTRTRKLLLHTKEISKLFGAIERRGYTLVALSIYWKKGLAKVELGLGKGKKDYDKRATEKDRDWNREKQRIFSHEKKSG